MDLTLSEAEESFAAEARGWLAANVEPPPAFASVEEEVGWGQAWQARCAADRWVAIGWPSAVGGRDATPIQMALFNMEYARSGAPQPVNRVGINLTGPTVLAHGSEEQQTRWLPSILDASEIWCQLFSEPEAGSDLASLRTTAEAVDGGWVLNGQKVWTSYAGFARWGIALVRTDPAASKHRGLSMVVVDMAADGVDIRPLRQITDEAEFNEVFLTDVFVAEDNLIGGLHEGWAVANTTLAHERGTNFPFKEQVVHEGHLDRLLRQADRDGALDDTTPADELAQAFVELRLLRLQNWRTLSRLGRGIAPGAESSVVKLTWSALTEQLSATALRLQGDQGSLWSDYADDRQWQRQWLWSRSASIAGGTSEIQRTIIGERILGLPRG